MGKVKLISFRVSEEEYQKLERDASAASINISKYLRALVLDNVPKEDKSKQKLACRFCELYKVITDEGLQNNDALMKEVDSLCQILY